MIADITRFDITSTNLPKTDNFTIYTIPARKLFRLRTADQQQPEYNDNTSNILQL
ncbi:hypothetical protein LA52FAK_36270 [Desulforhopalus sp. 52FAK]